MPRLARTLLVAFVLLAGLGAVPAFATGAADGEGGDPGFLNVVDVYDAYDQPTFLFETQQADCLSIGSLAIAGVNGFSVDFDDPNSGTIILTPDTPGGFYDLGYTCDTEGDEVVFTGSIDFGYVQVDKVVEGTAPAGVQFTIDLTCEGDVRSGEGAYGGDTEGAPLPFIDTTLTFGPSGGTQTVVHSTAQRCTITETGTGGATTVTVETSDCAENEAAPEVTSGTFDIFAPITCPQTVTNVFRDAAVDDDDVVGGSPTFTG